MIYNTILETIGRTPLVRLNSIVPKGSSDIFVKIESFNPGGSVKDRVALSMIEDAERNGKLTRGMVIVEPTSGNTGIGLAMVSASRGYRLILTMPNTMSVERRKLLKALGAELVLTPGSEGMGGAVAKAKEMAEGDRNIFVPQQFENPSNPEVHRTTTAMEIYEDIPDLDAFVSAVGTGGTLTGVGRGLRDLGSQGHASSCGTCVVPCALWWQTRASWDTGHRGRVRSKGPRSGAGR